MSTHHNASIRRRARRAGVAFLAVTFCMCAAPVSERATAAPQQQNQKLAPDQNDDVTYPDVVVVCGKVPGDAAFVSHATVIVEVAVLPALEAVTARHTHASGGLEATTLPEADRPSHDQEDGSPGDHQMASPQLHSVHSEEAQTGAARARIGGALRGIGGDGLAGQRLPARHRTADALRQSRRAGARIAPRPERLLHQPILA